MKHKASGCYADENLSGRLAKCADLSGSDRSSLHEDSDRQGATLDNCESGTGGTTMAFPRLLEGQQNQPKPHMDLFSEVMVKTTFDLLASSAKMPDKGS